MNITKAKELLTVLADGINPITGEILPETDSCNQVEVVRALNIVLRATTSSSEKSAKPTHGRAGKPWTIDDERELCQLFDAGYSRKFLSEHFERSQGAITSRLIKLGKITDID